MTWLPLESKMFTSVSHDADKQILYLRFRKTGDVYRYFDVAGKTVSPTTMRAMSRVFAGAGRLWRRPSRSYEPQATPKTLDWNYSDDFQAVSFQRRLSRERSRVGDKTKP
jgi:hypothetical protein